MTATGESGNLIIDKKEIVEALSRQFKVVFSDPEESDLNTGHDITVSESITSGDDDVDFTVKDILDAIKEMKPDAAPGSWSGRNTGHTAEKLC